MKNLYKILILTIFLTPISALGADVRSGGELFIEGDSPVLENLYIGSGKVDLKRDVNADLSIAGASINVESNVSGDVTLAGGHVDFSGTSSDDIKIAGGTVVFSGVAEKDLVLIGGTLTIEDGAVIKGDLIALGGNVFFSGDVRSRAKIVAGNVFINGIINSDTEITTQHLVFGEKSKVNGNLSYFAPEQATIQENTELGGEIMFNQIESLRDNSFVKRIILNVISFWILLRFITTLLLAFILVYVFRFFSQTVTRYAISNYGKSFLFGLLFIVFAPIVSIVFFVSLIALPIAVLLMLAYVFIAIVATGVSGILVGIIFKKIFKRENANVISFQSATLGVIILTALQFIPFIGDIVRATITIISIGAIINYLYTNIRFREQVIN